MKDYEQQTTRKVEREPKNKYGIKKRKYGGVKDQEKIENQKYRLESCSSVSCSKPSGQDILDFVWRITEGKKQHMNPTFILLFGGLASGKSTSIKKLATSLKLEPIEDFVYLDLDDIRLESSEYRKNLSGVACKRQHPELQSREWYWPKTVGTIGKSNVEREEGWVDSKGQFMSNMDVMKDKNCRWYTSHLTFQPTEKTVGFDGYSILAFLLKYGYNVIYNASCTDVIHCMRDILDIVPIKYNIKIIGIYCNVQRAVERGISRSTKEGRYTDEQIIRGSHENFQGKIRGLEEWLVRRRKDQRDNKKGYFVVAYRNDDEWQGVMYSREV
jgi:hypothetical protein